MISVRGDWVPNLRPPPKKKQKKTDIIIHYNSEIRSPHDSKFQLLHSAQNRTSVLDDKVVGFVAQCHRLVRKWNLHKCEGRNHIPRRIVKLSIVEWDFFLQPWLFWNCERRKKTHRRMGAILGVQPVDCTQNGTIDWNKGSLTTGELTMAVW